MTITLEQSFAAAFVVVISCWVVFAVILLRRGGQVKTVDAKRARASDYGLGLQGLAYLVLFIIRREPFTQLSTYNSLNWLFVSLAVILAVGSIWIIAVAINTLGKEWSVKARLIEGHRLVTAGPYRFVRNPIYTGMLGMLLATGLVISRWPALLIAVAIFFVGTMIRIRSEEQLLRSAFGSEFDNYSRRVSAIIPFIF